MSSNVGKNLALLAVSLFFGLVFVEIAVRIIEPRGVLREDFVAHDPILHHKFIPGARSRYKKPEFDTSYAINSLGLRDEEMPREKPAGTMRILMLGDSFTEGIGVEQAETFSSLLQDRLDGRHSGQRWQVINAGVGSYSPLLEYLYLKNGGLQLQPDLVILNFDLSDVFDDLQYAQLATFDPEGEPVAVRAEPERPEESWLKETLVAVKDFFKKHTRLYNFLRRRIDVRAAPGKENFSGDVRLDKYAMVRDDVGPANDRDWTLTYGYLIRIRDLLKARGIDFWVTVYPYGLQISPREWDDGRVYWGFQKDRVYSTRALDWVERFCRGNGIPVVNTTSDFQERSRTVFPLFFAGDGHWHAAGHQVVADALARALEPYVRAREAGALPAAAGGGAPSSP